MLPVGSRPSSAYFMTILAALCVWTVVGCEPSDCPVKDCKALRAKNCEQAGVTGEALKACKETEQGYKRVMEPTWAQKEREEMAAFNAALQALPARTIPRNRYESTSLGLLNSKYECCFSAFTDATEALKHPLYGKRLHVQGKIISSKERGESEFWVEAQDTADEKNVWHLDVDIESLTRQERSFIKSQCNVPLTLEGCAGKFVWDYRAD